MVFFRVAVVFFLVVAILIGAIALVRVNNYSKHQKKSRKNKYSNLIPYSAILDIPVGPEGRYITAGSSSSTANTPSLLPPLLWIVPHHGNLVNLFVSLPNFILDPGVQVVTTVYIYPGGTGPPLLTSLSTIITGPLIHNHNTSTRVQVQSGDGVAVFV